MGDFGLDQVIERVRRELPGMRVQADRLEDIVVERVRVTGVALVDGRLRQYGGQALFPAACPLYDERSANLVESMREYRARVRAAKVWPGVMDYETGEPAPSVPFTHVSFGEWVEHPDA